MNFRTSPSKEEDVDPLQTFSCIDHLGGQSADPHCSYIACDMLACYYNSVMAVILYIMGMIDSPLGRRCGAEEEISARVLCECEAFATLIYTYLCYFFLDPEDLRSLSLGAVWNHLERAGLP